MQTHLYEVGGGVISFIAKQSDRDELTIDQFICGAKSGIEWWENNLWESANSINSHPCQIPLLTIIRPERW